jgi:hypothetical protein
MSEEGDDFDELLKSGTTGPSFTGFAEANHAVA